MKALAEPRKSREGRKASSGNARAEDHNSRFIPPDLRAPLERVRASSLDTTLSLLLDSLLAPLHSINSTPIPASCSSSSSCLSSSLSSGSFVDANTVRKQYQIAIICLEMLRSIVEEGVELRSRGYPHHRDSNDNGECQNEQDMGGSFEHFSSSPLESHFLVIVYTLVMFTFVMLSRAAPSTRCPLAPPTR